MAKRLVIIGAGGHGKVAADIAEMMDCYDVICFLDDAIEDDEVMGFSVVGSCEEYAKWKDKADYFVAIGNSKTRQKWIDELKDFGANVATLIHPNAVIGQDVFIGYGTIIMAGTVINPGCRIGNGVIINTCSSVDHDNEIGNYCHVSVGAHLAGTVTVGEHTMIGAGATVINNVDIGEQCVIGAGAVVVKNIKGKGTYVGVPARKLVTK